MGSAGLDCGLREIMNSSNKKNWAIITAVGVPIIALTGYCGYQIFSDKEPIYTQDSFKVSASERPLSESDRVWGAAPNSACAALNNANIITSPYGLIDPANNVYGCSTAEIEIPNQKAKKTMQYLVTGFADKATSIRLVMKIEGKQATKEAIAARKSWAVYSALLAQTVFSQQLSEQEMQQLANLKEGEEYSRNYNLQLISNGEYVQKDNVGIYTYEIRGLPVLNGG